MIFPVGTEHVSNIGIREFVSKRFPSSIPELEIKAAEPLKVLLDY
jgi:hypothetical protein